MNRKVFFDHVRKTVFGGRLSAQQVDGMLRILDYRAEHYPDMPDAELAYLLATAKWETASTMQPVQEYGSQAYLRSKKYWPWIGRGLVQITWKANYLKYGITDPAKALEWPTALHVIFDGMIKGMFTGKKLADYINDNGADYVGARRIINGTDKAKQIAALAVAFRKALETAADALPIEGDKTVPVDPPTLPKPAAKSTTIWAQIVQWVATGGAAVLTALGTIPWQTAAVVGGVVIIGAGLWIIRERLIKRTEHGI